MNCLDPKCTNEGIPALSGYCEDCFPKHEDDIERATKKRYDDARNRSQQEP